MPYYTTETDANHDLRKVVKFPIRFKDSTGRKTIPTKSMIEACQKDKKAIIKTIPDNKLREPAKNSGSFNPNKKTSITTTYNRDELVSEYTKRMANVICLVVMHLFLKIMFHI